MNKKSNAELRDQILRLLNRATKKEMMVILAYIKVLLGGVEHE